MTIMARTGGAPGDSERCNEGGRGIAAAAGMVVARRVFPALVVGKMLLGASAHAATLVVDDLNDPGTQDDRQCSLREALNAVNIGAEDADDCRNSVSDPFGTGDTVLFDKAIAGDTIKLAGTQLAISESVDVFGPESGDPEGIVIDAQGGSRVLRVDATARKVNLDSLTMANGATGGSGLNGGGVDVAAGVLVKLSNCVLSGSTASGDGGAIHVAGSGTELTLDECVVSGNTSIRGGGIALTSGALDIDDSEITGNTVLSPYGGGIYVTSTSGAPATADIRGSQISGNTAFSTNGSGGIELNGEGGMLLLSGSEVSGNVGRGIEVVDAQLDLDGTVVSNHSQTTSAGGGIRVTGAGSAVVEDSTITGNTSAQSGGGMHFTGTSLSIIRSSLVGNSAASVGGGLSAGGTSSLELLRSTISGNQSDSRGGGMQIGGTADIRHSTISGNSSATYGGGMFVTLGAGAVVVSFTTFAGNASPQGGSNLRSLGSATNLNANLIVNGQGGGNCSGLAPAITSTSFSDDASCAGVPEHPDAGVRLGPLADNGGSTLTHALFVGNPAIDASTAAGCLGDDQRSAPRPFDGDGLGGSGGDECDLGAVEFTDSDYDGIIDQYEIDNGLDPGDAAAPNGAGDDLDQDGVANIDEFEGATASDDPDSDNDGIGDARDVLPLDGTNNACVRNALGPGATEFDVTAMSGMLTQCAAEASIVVRGTAVLELPDARVEFIAPEVRFDPLITVPLGTQLSVESVDPTPGS